MNLSSGLSALIRRFFFRQYLVIQHGLHRVPGESAGRLTRYGRALRGLVTYPLPRDRALSLCEAPTHPQPLKTRAQVDDSYRRALALGLKPHKAPEKNWDFLNAFSLVLARQRRADVVVDMGVGDAGSVILNWLALYGYRQLHGCDLYVTPHRTGPIRYTRQDIEQTAYPDNFADVITCLSVIEHGVDMTRFLPECRRVLKPGGLLVISTDFWCEPLDLAGVEDELGPVRIFTPDDIRRDVLDVAASCGLQVVGEPDFACGEPVVNRPSVPAIDRRYTFYTLHAERPPA